MISRKVGRTCRISIFILTIVSCNSAQAQARKAIEDAPEEEEFGSYLKDPIPQLIAGGLLTRMFHQVDACAKMINSACEDSLVERVQKSPPAPENFVNYAKYTNPKNTLAYFINPKPDIPRFFSTVPEEVFWVFTPEDRVHRNTKHVKPTPDNIKDATLSLLMNLPNCTALDRPLFDVLQAQKSPGEAEELVPKMGLCFEGLVALSAERFQETLHTQLKKDFATHPKYWKLLYRLEQEEESAKYNKMGWKRWLRPLGLVCVVGLLGAASGTLYWYTRSKSQAINWHDIKMPDIKMPDIKMPDIKMPDIKMSDIKLTKICDFGFASCYWRCCSLFMSAEEKAEVNLKHKLLAITTCKKLERSAMETAKTDRTAAIHAVVLQLDEFTAR